MVAIGQDGGDPDGSTKVEVRNTVVASETSTGTRRSPTVMRAVVSAILVVLVAVVSTGCLTGDIKVKVDKDGSGVINIKVFPDDELQKILVAANAIPAAKEAVRAVDGSTFKDIVDDGRVGYQVNLPFDDYTDLVDVATGFVPIAGTQIHLFSSFQLTENRDQWTLRAALAPDIFSDAFRAEPELQQLIDSEGRAALNSDLRLTISLPGQITRTNGDQTGSGTAVWALKSGSEQQLMMVTQPKPLLTMVQKVFAGAAMAVLVGIVLLVWGSRHSWKGSGERKERKRAKRITFGGPAGSASKWDNSGPLAAAPEGTRPTSGPMPPRSIPTMDASARSAAGVAPKAAPVIDLPPVSAPVAPAVDPTVPDPFAPHRPGAPLPGYAVVHPDVPAAGPSAVAPPVAPMVDPTMPNPFAPHRPGAPLRSDQGNGATEAPHYGATPYAPIGGAVGGDYGDYDEYPESGVPPTAVAPESDSAEPVDAESVDAQPVDAQPGVPGDAPMGAFSMEPTTAVFGTSGPGVAGDAPVGAFSAEPTSSSWEPQVEPAPYIPPAEYAEPAPYVPSAPYIPPAEYAEPAEYSEPAESHFYPDITSGEPMEPTPSFDGPPTVSYRDAVAENATAHYGEIYNDPENELFGVEAKAQVEPSRAAEPASAVDPSWAAEPAPAAEPASAVEPAPAVEPLGDETPGPVDDAIPADWYPDPDDPTRYRWWDGVDWTDYVSGPDS